MISRTEAASKLRPEELIILFDDGEVDFSWYPWEIDKAVQLWEEGVPFPEMVDELRSSRRIYDERAIDVFMLLTYLSLKGRIVKRDGGICMGID